MYTFISPENSFKIEKAVSYLVKEYNESGKNPKPVILHSLRVGIYLLESGYETDIVITGILHDLIEDSEVSFNDIKNNFSSDIATWVEAVSFKPDINDPIEQYREMFKRTISAGKIPTIVKAADILANSIYIHLVPDLEKQRMLLQKILYFIDIATSLSSEPVLQELKTCYDEENDRLTKLENKKC